MGGSPTFGWESPQWVSSCSQDRKNSEEGETKKVRLELASGDTQDSEDKKRKREVGQMRSLGRSGATGVVHANECSYFKIEFAQVPENSMGL